MEATDEKYGFIPEEDAAEYSAKRENQLKYFKLKLKAHVAQIVNKFDYQNRELLKES